MADSNADRSRSPRAPKHSLQQALAYARLIYEGVHRSSVSSNVAYELMGFAGKSGTSATALGSVRQFGLIEGTGDKTRISDLALTIFEPASSQEKAGAIFEAAQRPDVFTSIRDRFSGRIPNADEPIRAYLIRDLGFSRTGADETIGSLRQTEHEVARAQQELGGSDTLSSKRYEEHAASQHAGSEVRSEPVAGEQSPVQVSNAAGMLRFTLTRECAAEIRFLGEPNDRAIRNLIRHLELLQEAFGEE